MLWGWEVEGSSSESRLMAGVFSSGIEPLGYINSEGVSEWVSFVTMDIRVDWCFTKLIIQVKFHFMGSVLGYVLKKRQNSTAEDWKYVKPCVHHILFMNDVIYRDRDPLYLNKQNLSLWYLCLSINIFMLTHFKVFLFPNTMLNSFRNRTYMVSL